MESMKISGVYKITNPEGKIYVGSSSNVYSRFKKEYQCTKTKRIRFVNESINKYGYENHIFEIIEKCDVYMLTERERYWQEYFNCLYPNGLNRNLVKTSIKKQSHCEEAIQIMGENRKGVKAWNKGIPTSESTKKTIKERYSPLQRGVCRLIMDTRTGVFYYCAREAAEAFGFSVSNLRGYLGAPNKDYKINNTHLIYV